VEERKGSNLIRTKPGVRAKGGNKRGGGGGGTFLLGGRGIWILSSENPNPKCGKGHHPVGTGPHQQGKRIFQEGSSKLIISMSSGESPKGIGEMEFVKLVQKKGENSEEGGGK